MLCMSTNGPITAARLLVLVVFAASASCTSIGQSTTAPSNSRCSVRLTNSVDTSPATGGSGTLSLDLARECAWTASSGAAWVVITSASSGQGGGSISYRVAANTEPAPRRATIDVNDVGTTINQAADCRYRVSPLTASVDAAGGAITVHVQTDASCEWSAAAGAAWIGVNGDGTRKGDGAVTLAVTANSGATRSGTVRVAGQTVTLTQATASCASTITPTGETASAAGGSATVAVSAGGHCPWTAASNAPWITIASNARSGAGTVQIAIAPNPGPARTGTATIAAQTFTVTQAAAPCTFTVAPATLDVPSGGGEQLANVTTRADCAWTAAATVPWVTVTAGSSASGSGTVRLTIAANGGDARTGALVVGGQTSTVRQEAAPCTFALATASQRYDAAGGYGSIGVVAARPSCGWTAVSNNTDWLVITDRGAGTGNGLVNFSVAVNAGAQRVGTLTIGGQTFWITQEPR